MLKTTESPNKLTIIKQKLSPQQMVLAEWISTPSSSRNPKTQVALAEQLGVNPCTLSEWKRMPEFRQAIDEILGTRGRELVPEAIQKLRDSLNSTNAKVAFEAARDILNRWGQITRHGTIIASIKDLYEKYHGASTESNGGATP